MSHISTAVLTALVFWAVSQGARGITLEDIDVDRIIATLEASHGAALQILYNRGLDALLDFVNLETEARGRSEVSLPDIREEISVGSVRGSFEADQGVLSDLATIQRVGDARITRGEGSFTIAAVLGLAEVRVRYGHYRAKLGSSGPSVSGDLEGEVGTNSIRASATISLSGANCSAVLNEVKVEDLQGLKVKVSGSGFGPLNWLLSTATSSFARSNRDKIIAKLEEGLTKLATKSLSKVRCDNINPIF